MLAKWRLYQPFQRSLLRCFSGSGRVATKDNVVLSPFPDVAMSEKSYFDYVFEHVDKRSNMTSVVNGLTDESWRFSDVKEKSMMFGSSLKDLPGCHTLGVFLPNCIQYPVIFSGAAYANVTTTTMNPIYTPGEIAKQLRLAKASYVITSSDHLETLNESSKLLNRKIQPILIDKKVGGCLHMDDMIQGATIFPQEQIDVHNEVITLPFSSGTTGAPKGVMLTHFNLVSNMVQSLDTHPSQKVLPESTDVDQSVLLCILPLYHIYAMNVAMGPALRTGAKLVMLPKFDSATFLSALSTYRPTNLHLAPPLLSFLASSSQVNRDHMESVKDIIVGAAPLGPALIEQFKEKFPDPTLREAWGMSEISPVGLMTQRGGMKIGSCGVAVPNSKFKIVDVETGENLGPKKVGELCCSGPMVMKGYINNQKATDETIKDGWLHTGDVAYYDEEGYIFIVDRIKELIKVKGYQVPPAEIEDLLRAMVGVKDVAVIGIPHDKYGEVPRAYVVREDPGLSEPLVQDYVMNNMAAYKQLIGGVEFIDEIPKSAAGKILRRVLLEKFQTMNKP